MLSVAICLGFAWGMLSSINNLFPKPQLRHLISFITNESVQERHNNDWQTRVNIHKKASHTANIAMVGDSITQRADWHDLLDRSDVDNRGIGGDTSTLILKRLDSIYKPHYTLYVLMFGINDFYREADTEYVFNNYQTIIKHLTRSNARVIVQSTLYCNPLKAPLGCNDVNKKVYQLNNKLKSMTVPNYNFVDINMALSDNNALKSDLTHDGVHLNLAGYQTWATLLSENILTQYMLN